MKGPLLTHTTLLLIGLSIIFYSCKSDDSPISVLTYSTPKITNATANTDDWIYASDEDGNILDVKQYESNQEVVLKSNKVKAGQKVNITMLTYATYVSSYINIRTYLGVPANEAWSYGISPYEGTPTSPATLKILNYTSSSPDITVSTNGGETATILSGHTPIVSNSITVPIQVKNSASPIYITGFNGNQSIYAEKANVTPGSTVTVDLAIDFKPVQHSVDVNTASGSSTFATISGVRKSEISVDPYYLQGYTHSTITNKIKGSFKMGYNDGFDLYKTNVASSGNFVLKAYYKIGTPPTSITLPDYTNTTTSKTFNNFVSTLSGKYNMRTSWWNQTNSSTLVSWYVFGPDDGKQKLQNIPTEIKSKYPFIDTDKFDLIETAFYIYTDGFQYKDYVNSLMKPDMWPLYSKEYQTIAFTNH